MVERPSTLDTLVTIAEAWARRGTCIRAQVGCVAALDGRAIASGYNGAPAGMPHCDHPRSEAGAGYASAVAIAVQAPNMETCRTAIHAEANLVAFAARHGIALNGAEVVTTLTPCFVCAGLLINAGIVGVYCLNEYRDSAGVDLLRDATIDVVLL